MKDLKHLIYFEKLLESANNELVQQAQADGGLSPFSAVLSPGMYIAEIVKRLYQSEAMKTKYPDTHFFTGHCTGDYVFGVMKNRMGEYLRAFSCGYQDSDRVILHKKSFRDLTVEAFPTLK